MARAPIPKFLNPNFRRILIRPLLNLDDLAGWAYQLGFHDLNPAGWHVTTARAVPMAVPPDAASLMFPSGSRGVARMGGLLAVVLPERRLIRRHRAVIASGASWDFRRYIPHVSFAVDDRRDISLVPPYTGLLAFGPEAIE